MVAAVGTKSNVTKNVSASASAKKSPIVRKVVAANAEAAPAKTIVKPIRAASKPALKTAAKTPAKSASKAITKVAAKPASKVDAKPSTASVKALPKRATTTNSAAVKATALVEKEKKTKLVRDSFTMPETEYAVLSTVKKNCLKAGIEVKKSQLLRIGLALLNKTDTATLKKLIADLEPLKAGRPKKAK